MSKRYKVRSGDKVETVEGKLALQALVRDGVLSPKDLIRDLPNGPWVQASRHPDTRLVFVAATKPSTRIVADRPAPPSDAVTADWEARKAKPTVDAPVLDLNRGSLPSRREATTNAPPPEELIAAMLAEDADVDAALQMADATEISAAVPEFSGVGLATDPMTVSAELYAGLPETGSSDTELERTEDRPMLFSDDLAMESDDITAERNPVPRRLGRPSLQQKSRPQLVRPSLTPRSTQPGGRPSLPPNANEGTNPASPHAIDHVARALAPPKPSIPTPAKRPVPSEPRPIAATNPLAPPPSHVPAATAETVDSSDGHMEVLLRARTDYLGRASTLEAMESEPVRAAYHSANGLPPVPYVPVGGPPADASTDAATAHPSSDEGGGSDDFTQPTPAPQLPPPPQLQTPKRRRRGLALVGLGLVVVAAAGIAFALYWVAGRDAAAPESPTLRGTTDSVGAADVSDAQELAAEPDTTAAIEVEVAAPPAPTPPELPKQALSELSWTPWVAGTKWIYRIKREPLGPEDEAGQSEYRVVREVDTAEQSVTGDALVVKVKERGGSSDTRVRTLTYRVTADCVELVQAPKSETLRGCVSPADGVDAEIIEMVGPSWAISHHLKTTGGGELWYAADIGIVRAEGRDHQGRRTTVTLEGYATANESAEIGGLSDFEPLICDWKTSRKARKGKVTIDFPEGGAYRSVSAASGATRVAWTLEGVDGVDDRTGERSIPIVRAKAWQEREGAVVHALLHLENEREASMFFIAFDGAGVASERELRFSKTGQERFGAMMLTAPDGCFVRVIARSAGGSKVLDLELAESGPTRIHGSLEPSEEP